MPNPVVPSPWEQFPVTVAALLTVALITAIVTLIWRASSRVLARRPDFVLTKRVDSWEIERTKRRTAFALSMDIGRWNGNGAQLQTEPMHAAYGDLPHRERFEVNAHNGEIWFHWIDRGRLYCRTIDMNVDGPIEVTGTRFTPTDTVRT